MMVQRLLPVPGCEGIWALPFPISFINGDLYSQHSWWFISTRGWILVALSAAHVLAWQSKWSKMCLCLALEEGVWCVALLWFYPHCECSWYNLRLWFLLMLICLFRMAVGPLRFLFFLLYCQKDYTAWYKCWESRASEHTFLQLPC